LSRLTMPEPWHGRRTNNLSCPLRWIVGSSREIIHAVAGSGRFPHLEWMNRHVRNLFWNSDRYSGKCENESLLDMPLEITESKPEWCRRS
jgi:hypothetical protein